MAEELTPLEIEARRVTSLELDQLFADTLAQCLSIMAESSTKAWNADAHPRHPEGTPVDPSTGEGGGRFAPKDGSAGSSSGDSKRDFVVAMTGDTEASVRLASKERESVTVQGGNMPPAERIRRLVGMCDTKPAVADTTVQFLAEREPEIADWPFERVYVVAEDGTLLGEGQGDYNEVAVYIDRDDRRRKIVTHNHPNLSAPSKTDIEAAIDHNVSQMRVVSGHDIFIVNLPEVHFPNEYKRLFGVAFDRTQSAVTQEYARRYTNGEISLYEANSQVSHAIWHRFIDEYGEKLSMSIERVPLNDEPKRPAYDKMIRSIAVDGVRQLTFVVDRGATDDLTNKLPAPERLAGARYMVLAGQTPTGDYVDTFNAAPDPKLVGYALTNNVESFYSLKPELSYRVSATRPVSPGRWQEIEARYNANYKKYLAESKSALGDKFQEQYGLEHARNMAWRATAADTPEIDYERTYREGKDPWVVTAGSSSKALAAIKAYAMVRYMAGVPVKSAWIESDHPRHRAGTSEGGFFDVPYGPVGPE